MCKVLNNYLLSSSVLDPIMVFALSLFVFFRVSVVVQRIAIVLQLEECIKLYSIST